MSILSSMRAHQPFIRILVAAGVAIAHALVLRVGADVFDVIGGQALDRVLVGADRPLHFGLEDVFVFLAHDGQQLLVFLLQFLIGDQRMMAQPAFQFVHHHERIDRLIELGLMADQRIADLVLNVARADALHSFARGFFLQFLDAVFGEAGNALAVVELELLQLGDAGFLRLGQTRQHRPHRGHLDRVRGDVDALDLLGAEILEINLDLIVEPDVVRHVDLDGAVAERLHHFVALELLVFRLVGVAEDHFVDVGLGEFLGLDQVFLAGAQQIVEKRHIELEHFDEFDDAAIGDIQFAVEVEGAGIGIGAVLGDFAVVDVAGELGAVLVFFVLGLERADAAAVFFRQDQALAP